LPITAYVAGGALFAGLVGRHQRAWGRRRAFQFGLVVAIGNDRALRLGGMARPFLDAGARRDARRLLQRQCRPVPLRRAELVEPPFKERAISWVLAGGILGAVAGPNLARWTRDVLPAEFAGAYAALALVALRVAVDGLVDPLSAAGAADAGRAGRRLARSRRSRCSSSPCWRRALGYGVMNLLMAATPIAMAMCSHPFDNTALVIEWHVLGMFVPSFFTGSLIKRFGVLRVMAAASPSREPASRWR
jgi:hypothetical protein